MSYKTNLIECCGLIGVHDLSDMTTRGIERDINNAVDAYGAQCDGHECECEDRDDCEGHDCDGTCPQGPGMCIATTNASQNRNCGPELRGAGFHPVLETLNPNSGSRITLWVKDISEGKMPMVIDKPAAPAPEPDTELIAALKQYVERNPNPRTRAAQALVSAFKKQFPE